MLETIIEAVIKWGVPLLCGAVAAWAAAAIKRERRKVDAIGEGVRALLRAEVIRAHRDYYEDGVPITISQRSHLGDVYQAYHDLGGNGTATRLWEDLKELEVRA